MDKKIMIEKRIRSFMIELVNLEGYTPKTAWEFIRALIIIKVT